MIVQAMYCLRNVKELTPVLELYIRLSCPEVEENDIFRYPGPISMVSFCGLSFEERSPTLIFPTYVSR